MTNYSIQKTVTGDFVDIVTKVKEALKKEGFGVLTEINVSETLKKKLNLTYPRYVILGACNPSSAYAILQQEKEIGLLLPCNIIVYEENDRVMVSSIRPTVAMQILENNKVETIAREVEEKLERVIASL